MHPFPLDPHRFIAWLPAGLAGVRGFLRVASHRTGLPNALVAAIVLVISLRLARRSFRLGVEIAVAALALVAATRLGWLSW